MTTSKPAQRPTIELDNLTLGYERHPAVHHLSLTIAPGSLVALVGPNGAGKSTLIKALAGQLRPISGQLRGLASQRIAWLPQHTELDRSFPIPVRDMVAMGLWHQVGALRRFSAQHRQQCDAALAAVGLTGFEERSLNTLSGGQLQRALFARLILQDAPVVLLDEPFAAVDNRTTDDLLALLHRWHAQGKTVVAVLHDLAQVRAHFPLTLLLARERVAWGPTASVLTRAHWAQAQRMQEPFDDDAPLCEAETTAATAPETAAAPTAPHEHKHGHSHRHAHTHTALHGHAHPSAHATTTAPKAIP
ncbi:MAG: zinc ABC transporter ATP-binding protein AztA [Hydrogenophaga sp.]|nr:zinc ABC transporter ATP-binding protein AztA [Hydrogenophaga sp.]